MQKHLILLILLFSQSLFAQRGRNGSFTVINSNVIVNEYTTLSADVASGASTISVASSSLNQNNRFPSPLSSGDLVLIIQMQGAGIQSGDSPSFGSILNYNSAGNYEWAEIKSILSASQIEISCGLQHAYTVSGNVQVVRVPRYISCTVNPTGSITAPSWNGTTGGIVVIETDLNLVVNGSINLNAKGFRGGTDGNTLAAYGAVQYASTDNQYGAEKGEGIAGTVATYDGLGGRYGRAAAANGGGGGNAHNGGGGGGSNAGDIAIYTGNGNPDITISSWAQAWNIEAPGFANSISSGGGRGGYTFSSANRNALVLGWDSQWGGDWRNNHGGFGGRPLDYSTGKIFLGGGGGSGEENNNYGTDGANGGGIVLVRCFGNVSGSGPITANGGNAGNTTGGQTGGTDGAGGGGGGGSVLLSCSGTISQISIDARGGNGGNQDVGVFISEAEGPGGGGGGGYIGLTNVLATVNVAGGTNGTTDSNGLSEFPPNGATKGGSGLIAQVAPLINITATADTLCGPGTATLTALNTPGAIYSWSSAPAGNPISTAAQVDFPATASSTVFISVCPLSQTLAVPITVQSAPPVNAGTDLVLCSGDTLQLSGITPGNFVWIAPASISDVNVLNPFVYPTETSVYILQSSINATCTREDTLTVTLMPDIEFTVSSDTTICFGTSAQLLANGAESYTWSPPALVDDAAASNPLTTATTSTYYTVTAVSDNFCAATRTVNLIVTPELIVDAGTDGQICEDQSTQLQASGNGILSWVADASLSNTAVTDPIASPAATTTYVLVSEDTFGCENRDSVVITVSNTLDLTISEDTVVCGGTTVQLHVSGGEIYLWNNATLLDDASSPDPVVTITSTTEFIVTAQNNGGCATTDTVVVAFVNPVILSVTGGGVFCNSDGTELALAGATAVTWFPSNNLSDPQSPVTIASPLESTFYYAEYTDVNGCQSQTAPVEVIPSVQPSAEFTFNQVSNYEVIFTSPGTPGVEYSWVIDGIGYSGATASHDFPFDGNYQVSHIASNDCGSDTVLQTVAVIKMVGIEKISSRAAEVFPNPSADNVTISIPASDKSAVITIRDASGKLVYQASASGNLHTLTTGEWAGGVYVIFWKTAEATYRAKLVH